MRARTPDRYDHGIMTMILSHENQNHPRRHLQSPLPRDHGRSCLQARIRHHHQARQAGGETRPGGERKRRHLRLLQGQRQNRNQGRHRLSHPQSRRVGRSCIDPARHSCGHLAGSGSSAHISKGAEGDSRKRARRSGDWRLSEHDACRDREACESRTDSARPRPGDCSF